jgi:ATP/maltotriose-dependent transcriptional regulator MalT
MTMSFLLHESPSDFDTSDLADYIRSSSLHPVGTRKDVPTIIEGQLCVPQTDAIVSRPRLLDLLERSGTQFGATLISGRAGTGKSTLAADFASRRESVAWYSVESADSRWEVFSSYFFASVCGRSAKRPKNIDSQRDNAIDEATIGEFLRDCFGRKRKVQNDLIVIDNIHHLFDTRWFSGFFNQLIVSLVPGLHLLMTCRSRPPAPLWRMRSKQMLNVVDESILHFTPAETRALCKLRGLPQNLGAEAHRCSGGRILKLIDSLDELSSKL